MRLDDRPAKGPFCYADGRGEGDLPRLREAIKGRGGRTGTRTPDPAYILGGLTGLKCPLRGDLPDQRGREEK